MTNMKIRLSQHMVALDIGPAGEDRFLAFGMDTTVYIEKPFAGGPWATTYQVGGLSPLPYETMAERVNAMQQALRIGEAVASWLNSTETEGDYEYERILRYLNEPGFKALAGLEEVQ